MISCKYCKMEKQVIAASLSYCSDCIREGSKAVMNSLQQVHTEVRRESGLPAETPANDGEPTCVICSRSCQPAPGEKGFCGLRENKDGKIFHHAGLPGLGIVEYYFDPLPTNCVADWVCPAKRESYAGKKNMAVFYGACILNCLFCQNWQYRTLTKQLSPSLSAGELADKVDAQTACICFFGGDPAPQVPHALSTARKALSKNPKLKICWESSGAFSDLFFPRVMDLSYRSGGTVKFDLKAYNENLYFALTGGDNKQMLKNFARCAEFSRRNNINLAVASTLLVPGYITEKEVFELASFIASHNPATPYSLLGFHPQFQMKDLPVTSRKEAEACYDAARKAGLKNVNLGNVHLLR